CNNVTAIPKDDCCRDGGLGRNQMMDGNNLLPTDFYMRVDNITDTKECCKRCYEEPSCVYYIHILDSNTCDIYGDSIRTCFPLFEPPPSSNGDEATGII
ncbi:6789_t:CDS:1, partial [Racocetra fulgida]